jgi:hypothetical protein
LPNDRPRGPWPLLPLAILAYLGGIGAATACFPFASDDHVHLAAAAAWRSPAAAFDPGLVPLRPLQHLWFWWVARWAADAPWLARAPILLLHLGSLLLCLRLLRALGLPPARRWLAALLVAAFPCVTNLTWVAAVGWPLRQFFLLLGLTAFVAWRRDRRWRHAALVLFALLGGLGAHQTALLLPCFCGAWLACVEAARPGFRWRAALGDPVLLTITALVLGYAVYVGLLRSERQHGLQSAAIVATNGAKALWSLAPGLLRRPALAWLGAGDAMFWCGLLASAAFGALLVIALARAAAGRFLLVVLGLDLALTAISVPGFEGRYVYLSGWLLAGGMALVAANGCRGARAIAVALAAAWLVDTIDQVREFRAGAAVLRQLRLDVVTAAAARPPGGPLVFVDVPAALGRERNVPAFRWGWPQALRSWGIAEPWLLWRTDPTWSTAQGELFLAADLPARVGGLARGIVLRFDVATGRLVTERVAR